jgi:hypothetical protein
LKIDIGPWKLKTSKLIACTSVLYICLGSI